MTILDIILLGIVQGLTEFLPVSSSGHLQLVQHFLGIQNLENHIFFDLVCHLGTLVAIAFIFFKEIKNSFINDRKLLAQIAIATLPLFPLVLIIKPIKSLYADPSYLGFFFMITSAILFLGTWLPSNNDIKKGTSSKKEALMIGFWQAVAIIPGISRSGSTIIGAKLLGWGSTQAATFSFLLAIPTILGGTALELFGLWKGTTDIPILPISYYLIAFAVSFGVGTFALRLLMEIAMKNKFYYFAWYCLFIGMFTTYFFY